MEPKNEILNALEEQARREEILISNSFAPMLVCEIIKDFPSPTGKLRPMDSASMMKAITHLIYYENYVALVEAIRWGQRAFTRKDMSEMLGAKITTPVWRILKNYLLVSSLCLYDVDEGFFYPTQDEEAWAVWDWACKYRRRKNMSPKI